MTGQAFITLAYVIASLCVVYKLAFLVRQAAQLSNVAAHVFRALAVLAGTAILYRMVRAVEGGDQMEWVDVLQQLGWCAILYFIIVVVGRRKNVW